MRTVNHVNNGKFLRETKGSRNSQKHVSTGFGFPLFCICGSAAAATVLLSGSEKRSEITQIAKTTEHVSTYL